MRNLVLGILVLAAASGCGMLKSAKQEGASTTDTEVADTSIAGLNLRIIRAGEADPSVPDPAADLKSERFTDKALVSGDQIIFEDNIYLPDAKNPRAVFLVWPEEWAGTKIQNVAVEHRLEDEHGEFSGAPERKPALFDTSTRRWYLPFSAFFSGESAGADPARQQQLVLDMQTSDGARKLIYVRLRLIGGAPRLKVIESDEPSHLADFGADDARNPNLMDQVHPASEDGLAVRSGSVTNTYNRELKLSFDARNAQPLELQSYVAQTTYHQDWVNPVPPNNVWHKPPVRDPLNWMVSAGKLKVGAVRVSHSSTLISEVLQLNRTGRTEAALAPGETVTWDWLAAPIARQTFCALPPTRIRHFEWWNGKIPCLDPFGNSPCPADTAFEMFTGGDFAEPWWVGGYLVKGFWQGRVTVANPWDEVPFEEMRASEEHALSSMNGLILKEAPAYPCQGLF